MCLFPINASLPLEGGRPNLDIEGDLRLPCGKCRECISKRAIDWATRAKHEISEHTENSFITLTYSPENLNSHFIIKSDFQKFVKRLRKQLKQKIKYMVSYEYGTHYLRPHMHAIFFGYNPNNQKFLKNTSSGHPLFTSPDISKLWDKGFHSIGTANEQTAYYIASYALKGKSKTIYHPDTGEECTLSDTMDVSKRPSIGLNYLSKNYKQLIDSETPLPRYYLKILEEHADAIKSKNPTKRQIKILKLFPELTDDLFEVHQNNLQNKFKSRSAREKHAKFTIDSQKSLQQSSHLRETFTDDQETISNFQKERLKQDRDNYVVFNKKKDKK